MAEGEMASVWLAKADTPKWEAIYVLNSLLQGLKKPTSPGQKVE
jgi:hypothetical protein